jgi:hypothetical protein
MPLRQRRETGRQQVHSQSSGWPLLCYIHILISELTIDHGRGLIAEESSEELSSELGHFPSHPIELSIDRGLA